MIKGVVILFFLSTQVEDTKLISASEDGQTELEVEMLVAPQPNQDVRPIGFDIPMGAVLADKGNFEFLNCEHNR